MTLQQRENIKDKVAWSKEKDEEGNYTNTKGPTEALSVLEEATKDWSNVEEQTYTLGETVFLEGSNAYTGCNQSLVCNTNTYTMPTRTARARMSTVQEAKKLGCTGWMKTCPIFMYNYLSSSISYGGTNNDKNSSFSYSLMNAWTSDSQCAYNIWYLGYIRNTKYNTIDISNYTSVRAVIVIRK